MADPTTLTDSTLERVAEIIGNVGGHSSTWEPAAREVLTLVSAVYDRDADALYVRFTDKPRVGPAIEITDTYVVDLDADGQPCGLEVLGVLRVVVQNMAAYRRREHERKAKGIPS